jgi:hypothetical protein
MHIRRRKFRRLAGASYARNDGKFDEVFTLKLATLKSANHDGELIVVDKSLSIAIRASNIAPTMQSALDDWPTTAPGLEAIYQTLNKIPNLAHSPSIPSNMNHRYQERITGSTVVRTSATSNSYVKPRGAKKNGKLLARFPGLSGRF